MYPLTLIFLVEFNLENTLPQIRGGHLLGGRGVQGVDNVPRSAWVKTDAASKTAKATSVETHMLARYILPCKVHSVPPVPSAGFTMILLVLKYQSPPGPGNLFWFFPRTNRPPVTKSTPKVPGPRALNPPVPVPPPSPGVHLCFRWHTSPST
jgi:hypothetical protein